MQRPPSSSLRGGTIRTLAPVNTFDLDEASIPHSSSTAHFRTIPKGILSNSGGNQTWKNNNSDSESEYEPSKAYISAYPRKPRTFSSPSRSYAAINKDQDRNVASTYHRRTRSVTPPLVGPPQLPRHYETQTTSHLKTVRFPKQKRSLENVVSFERLGRPRDLNDDSDDDTGDADSEREWDDYRKAEFNIGGSHLEIDYEQSSPIPCVTPTVPSNVHLETLVLPRTQPPILHGSILVKNIAFQKAVVLRLTLDGWKTTTEVACRHVCTLPSLPSPFLPEEITPDSLKLTWDRFSFMFRLEETERIPAEFTLFLAARFTASGVGEWWDNNSGDDYKLILRKSVLGTLYMTAQMRWPLPLDDSDEECSSMDVTPSNTSSTPNSMPQGPSFSPQSRSGSSSPLIPDTVGSHRMGEAFEKVASRARAALSLRSSSPTAAHRTLTKTGRSEARKVQSNDSIGTQLENDDVYKGRDGIPDLSGQVGLCQLRPVFNGQYSAVYQGKIGEILVAVKVLKEIYGADAHTMQRKLGRERITWGKLRHRNVLPLYGFANDHELFQPFGAFISPWRPQGNARQFLEKRGKDLSAEQRLDLWKGVVAGVAYLHNHKPVLVHGDLKAVNILIDDHDQPQLCDFGLISILLEEGNSGMTTTSQHTGTDRYLAYELLNEQTVVPTTASDIYALGCTGLEFYFSQIPHARHKNNMRGQIFMAIKAGTPPATRTQPCDPQSEAFWGILDKCWMPGPGDRPKAEQLLAELQLPPFATTWTETDLSVTEHNATEGLSSSVPMPFVTWSDQEYAEFIQKFCFHQPPPPSQITSPSPELSVLSLGSSDGLKSFSGSSGGFASAATGYGSRYGYGHSRSSNP